MTELTVGQVARRTGVKISTVHFYEQKKLITSWRNNGNQRRFDRGVLRRIAIIKTAQQLGFSLAEITQALAHLPKNEAPTKNDWQDLSTQWRVNLDQRIKQLESMRDDLTNCIGCGCLSLENCPLYNQDDKLASQGTGAVLWHAD